MALDPTTDDRPALRRFVTWYPLVALVVVVIAVWLAKRGREEPASEPTTHSEVPALTAPASEADALGTEETPEEGAGRLDEAFARGRATSLAAREKAGDVAGLFGDRLKGLAGLVDGEALMRKGETAARFVPFVGPYVRFHRARRLYAGGDDEQREAAKRQTVIALAELAIDAGSAGLGQAASGTGNLTDALAGAVDVADFMDSALSIHELLGEPLRLGGLVAATRSVDNAAGYALANVSGLDSFCGTLLELDSEEFAELSEKVPVWVNEVVESIDRATEDAEETAAEPGDGH